MHMRVLVVFLAQLLACGVICGRAWRSDTSHDAAVPALRPCWKCVRPRRHLHADAPMSLCVTAWTRSDTAAVALSG